MPKMDDISYLSAKLRSSDQPRPFLKWAGGKTKLLPQLLPLLPSALKTGQIKRYVEPFIGGGAMFFYLATHYQFSELVISDVSKELILCYTMIQQNVEELLQYLTELQKSYTETTSEKREELFYAIRSRFNQQAKQQCKVERVAQMIFLNHTCFNGLFRLNSKGGFNVPFGRYRNPKIFNATNLRLTAKLLQKTEIICADFEKSLAFADKATFFYFDPPYRPISKTSAFTSYAKDGFKDQDQVRLAKLFHKLHKRGAKLMLSNSDPQNNDPNDDFFAKLYAEFSLITTVKAARAINANGQKRGKVSELVITNYFS